MVCRNVSCNLGRKLLDGQCEGDTLITTYIKSNNISCFSTFIKLTPLHNTVPLPTRTILLAQKIIDVLNPIFNLPYWLEYGFGYFLSSDADGFIKYIIVNIIVPFYDTDQEMTYINFFASLINIGGNVSVKLSDPKTVLSVDIANYNFSFENGTVSIPSVSGLFVATLTQKYMNDFGNLLYNSTKRIVTINKLYLCPVVSISEYAIEVKNDILSVNVDGAHNKLYSKWEFEQYGDDIYMCFDDFMMIYKAFPVNSRSISENESFNPKHILSLICVSLSIVCLMVTIIIYLLFRVLRSQPGINNIMLAIFMLLAQGFYQFGAGQTSIASWACSFIGGICHFMWLAMMFSMTVCCTHMLMIFKKGVVISQTNSTRKTVKHLVIVICSSLVFVLINLSVSFVVSGGLNSGYGGEICYLSSPLMQLITFVLPSALALLANLCMFVYVVFKIWNVGRRSTSLLKKERNYMRVYVRLSALTGLTWIFGFLQFLLEFEVLEYIFIILNASQGVFIMFAFVLNRRVYLLMCTHGEISTNTTPLYTK